MWTWKEPLLTLTVKLQSIVIVITAAISTSEWMPYVLSFGAFLVNLESIRKHRIECCPSDTLRSGSIMIPCITFLGGSSGTETVPFPPVMWKSSPHPVIHCLKKGLFSRCPWPDCPCRGYWTHPLTARFSSRMKKWIFRNNNLAHSVLLWALPFSIHVIQ